MFLMSTLVHIDSLLKLKIMLMCVFMSLSFCQMCVWFVCAGSRGISLTCVLTPCRVFGVCLVLIILGAIGAAGWAVGETAPPIRIFLLKLTVWLRCGFWYDTFMTLLFSHALHSIMSSSSYSVVTYCTMEEDTGFYDGEWKMTVSLFKWHFDDLHYIPLKMLKLNWKRKHLNSTCCFLIVNTTLKWTKILMLSLTVQVNSADQHLRVFDSAQRRWRQVCSSSANELLASISCEEVGFVRWDHVKMTSKSFHEEFNDTELNYVRLF